MADLPNISSPLSLSASICARERQLPLPLVLAIIQVESGGDQYAWNPEPKYRYLWDVKRKAPFRALTDAENSSEIPPADFLSAAGDRDAEWWGQQASWGAMQLMGACARELGFVGHLPRLCDSHLGVDFGCRHLAAMRDRFLGKFGWGGVIAAWNAGSPRFDGVGVFVNQPYVNKVVAAGGLQGL